MKLKFRKKVRENQKMFSIDDLVPVNYLGKSYPYDPLVNLRNPKFIVASVIDSMFEGDYLAIKSSIRVHHQALGAKSLSSTTQKIFKRSLEELASKYTYWSEPQFFGHG